MNQKIETITPVARGDNGSVDVVRRRTHPVGPPPSEATDLLCSESPRADGTVRIRTIQEAREEWRRSRLNRTKSY